MLITHHQEQLDKRARKLAAFDYGPYWADIEDFGHGPPTGALAFGSAGGPVREAAGRLGHAVRVIILRLLAPLQVHRLQQVLLGISWVLIVEKNHSGQLYHYIRSLVDLPGKVLTFNRPGPLPLRPGEIEARILAPMHDA